MSKELDQVRKSRSFTKITNWLGWERCFCSGCTIWHKTFVQCKFYVSYGLRQVSRVADADRVERLGVNRWLGVVLIFLWAAVLATVITLRHQNGYVGWESLYWFEAFYRTGSIIFGGGQVRLAHTCKQLHETLAWFGAVT
jgi:hypothetical protein